MPFSLSRFRVRRARPAWPGWARLAIGAGALALAALLQWWPAAGAPRLADEWLRDRLLRLRVSTAPEPRVLVVDIDEASLAALGPWPWPRARLADLVEILLADYGARGVALDILLSKPADTAGDARLGMLARHGPLVLAQALDYQPGRPLPLREGVLAGAVAAADGVAATGYIGLQPAWAGMPRAGNIGFVPDPDGALRRLPMRSRFDARTYPALTLALAACCAGAPAPAVAAVERVDFRRDWNAYTVVSAADILRHTVAAPGLAGRLALVGSSSLGLGDRVATPLAASRPGLGVQAAMLSTLLDRQAGLTPARWPGRWLALLFSAAMALLATTLFGRLSAAAGVLLLAAGSAAWLGAAAALTPHDDHYAPSGPLLVNLLLLALAVPYQWHRAQRRSRRLLDTLRQYVAPSVVGELLRADLADPLAPRQLDVTTLIADMEGYTTQVEALPVQDAAALTRAFLDCLTAPVIDHQGTLDKYTGDGLVAFWGAPLAQAEHADLALAAARQITRRVAALSQARQAAGHAPLRVRIGIDSGLAMAGDFGTAFRSIYTAVGDSVNTAARLEQAARDLPHDIIVGAGTVERARRHRFVPLGQRQLRGKEKLTTLYALEDATTLDLPTTPPRAPGARGR